MSEESEPYPLSSHRILVCNAGSGSLEMMVTQNATERDHCQFEGTPSQVKEYFADYILSIQPCDAVLFRIVHLGEVKSHPVEVTSDTLATIAHWAPLAPLHNDIALNLINIAMQQWQHAKHYVFGDSVLFCELPNKARQYFLPTNLSPRWPIRKYGFHGIAHQSQWNTLRQQSAYSKVITVHLGGGGSLTAWKDDRVIDTTMGFTPTEGIPMTTRSGSLDPNIILHLLEKEQLPLDTLKQLVNGEAGLAGVSNTSGDYRDLKQESTPEAKLAIDMYTHELAKAIGAFVAILGGIDAIAIGGGLGVNQPDLRQRALGGLAHFGIQLDQAKNANTTALGAIHDSHSPCAVWVTPTRECEEMLRQFHLSEKERQ